MAETEGTAEPEPAAGGEASDDTKTVIGLVILFIILVWWIFFN